MTYLLALINDLLGIPDTKSKFFRWASNSDKMFSIFTEWNMRNLTLMISNCSYSTRSIWES